MVTSSCDAPAPRDFSARATLLMAALLCSGCYTTTHVVNVPPLRTKYPVSASGQYIDNGGALVTEDQYQVVQSFDFKKTVEAPRHEASEATLKLEAELDQILAQHQGDALTQVNIAATDYDPGSHGSAAGWKILGWTLGLTGATFAVAGAASDYESEGLIAVGGVFLGLGVLSYLAAAVADDPAVWSLQVKGNVVKQTSLGVLPPPAGTPTSSAASPAAGVPSAASPAAGVPSAASSGSASP
jgi:hypothetical protein